MKAAELTGPISHATRAEIEAELKRRGALPPDGWAIGQQPSAPCAHDFQFLRTERPGSTPVERANASDVDVFYCRRCLEHRKVAR